MSLTKVNYIDNSTIITAQNLNDIQDNIIQNSELVKRIAPRNLLDNSNFTNPVNQRGQTSYTGNGYSIDRWRGYHADTIHEVTSSGLKVSGANENYNLYQVLPENIDITKHYTAAACDVDNNIYIWSGVPDDTTTVNVCMYISNNIPLFRLRKATTWKWAALYEGEYTVETLPEYQSKGYGAELAECQRYLYKIPIYTRYRACGVNDNTIYFIISLPQCIRAGGYPTIDGTFNIRSVVGQTGQGDFVFSIAAGSGSDKILIGATKTAHGLTDVQLNCVTNVFLSRDL